MPKDADNQCQKQSKRHQSGRSLGAGEPGGDRKDELDKP